MAMRLHSTGESFGSVVRLREAGPFLLRESRYASALRLPPVEHERPYFSYLVGGGFRERNARGEHAYRAGSLHFHGQADPYSAVVGDGGMTCLSIVLPLAPVVPGNPMRSKSETATLTAAAARCYRELRATDIAAGLALEAACLDLMASSLRVEASRVHSAPRWLLAVEEFLHANLDRPIALAELAKIGGVHPAHLTRAFRRHRGGSPAELHRRLRIERARRALSETRDSIVEIALAAGFSSQSHFTRAFHRVVGTPPAAYRRATRG
jgi:AraC family transcriptional regulator